MGNGEIGLGFLYGVKFGEFLDGLKGEAELVVEDVNFELDDKMLGLWQVY